MRRREFITSVVGAISLRASLARAEQSSKVKRIAMVAPHRRSVDEIRNTPHYGTFLDELSRLGFTEGNNLIVDRYAGNGEMGRYGDLARAVVRTSPDAIYALGIPISQELKAASKTIPIVAMVTDPVASGLVSSLARPGSNLTAATMDGGVELHAKRLELLVEARPGASRVGFLCSSQIWSLPPAAAVREAAQRTRIALAHLSLGETPNEAAYVAAFAQLDRAAVDALLVSDEPAHLVNSKVLVDLAANAKIPAIYPFRDLAVAGGVMAYSVDLFEVNRAAARQMAEILRGTSAAEIPVYQPTKFQLIINTKTAQKIGLDLPTMMLARADEVIE